MIATLRLKLSGIAGTRAASSLLNAMSSSQPLEPTSTTTHPLIQPAKPAHLHNHSVVIIFEEIRVFQDALQHLTIASFYK